MRFNVTCSRYSKNDATRHLGSPCFHVEQPMCLFPLKRVNFGLRLTRWTTGNDDIDAQLYRLKPDRYKCAGTIVVDIYGLFWVTQSDMDEIADKIISKQFDHLVEQWNKLTEGWWLVHAIDHMYHKDLDIEPLQTVKLFIGELCL